MERYISDSLAAGIIRPSTSPLSAAFFCVLSLFLRSPATGFVYGSSQFRGGRGSDGLPPGSSSARLWTHLRLIALQLLLISLHLRVVAFKEYAQRQSTSDYYSKPVVLVRAPLILCLISPHLGVWLGEEDREALFYIQDCTDEAALGDLRGTPLDCTINCL